MGINFSALKKITLEFFTGAAAMAWAAVLQHNIYKTNPYVTFGSNYTSSSSLARFWLLSSALSILARFSLLSPETDERHRWATGQAGRGVDRQRR
ncbi:hypothetical protein BDZ97DRAFT_1982285 [Flammula alnicola]|nr:hypothetical protein BDZ97DRAFT_1982285 [Flammula alnicola]